MPYITRDQVSPKIPPQVMRDALDDDGDGQEDEGLFDRLVADASTTVDGYLAGLYTVPFAEPAPAKVQAAALVFVCELIYQRRNVELPNWLDGQLKFWRQHLEKVANREIPFEADKPKAFAPGAAVTENVAANAQST